MTLLTFGPRPALLHERRFRLMRWIFFDVDRIFSFESLTMLFDRPANDIASGKLFGFGDAVEPLDQNLRGPEVYNVLKIPVFVCAALFDNSPTGPRG